MAAGVEVERLIVRLIGDATSYQKMLRDAQVSSKKTADVVEKAGRRMEALKARLLAVGGAMRTAGRNIQSVGRSLTLRVTAPLAAIGALSVRAFSQFDQAMIESTSIMQTTGDQVERMKRLSLELSTKAVQGPAQLAESYFFLASAGLDAEAAMAALPQVAQFATAGAFDMALATDLLTDAQTAMGLSSADAAENLENLTRISDVFVAANELANTSVQQVAEAMTADAATAARNMGQELETTVAVLDAYGSAGKKAGEAGNLFGRATRLLTKAQRENGKAFEKFGIKVIDETTGEYRNFIDIIVDMENAFKDLKKPQRDAALETLGFAALAQKSITPLLGLGSAMKEYERKLLDAAGATDRVADKQMKSFGNQMKILRNQLTVVGIEIGEILAPMILRLNDFIQRGIKIWRNLSPAVKQTAVVFAIVAAVVGPLLIVFGGLTAIIGTAVSGFGVLLGAAAALFNPAGILIAGVIAATAAAFAYIIPWQKVFEAVKSFFTSAVGFIANFSENMAILWDFMTTNWSTILSDMARAFIVFGSNMLANTVVVITAMFRLWTAWQGFIVGIFERVFSAEFINAIVRASIKAAGIFVKFAKFAGKALTNAFSGKEISATEFIAKIKSDFQKGKAARTLAEIGQVMGGIITDEMANLTSPLEGFESSIKAPDFKFDFGATEKLAEEIFPPPAIAAGIEDAIGAVKPPPIPLTFTVGREAVALGSVEAARRLAEFRTATQGGIAGARGGDGAAAGGVPAGRAAGLGIVGGGTAIAPGAIRRDPTMARIAAGIETLVALGSDEADREEAAASEAEDFSL